MDSTVQAIKIDGTWHVLAVCLKSKCVAGASGALLPSIKEAVKRLTMLRKSRRASAAPNTWWVLEHRSGQVSERTVDYGG